MHKDPDYDRRVHDYKAAFEGMDNDGDGNITFEVGISLFMKEYVFFISKNLIPKLIHFVVNLIIQIFVFKE